MLIGLVHGVRPQSLALSGKRVCHGRDVVGVDAIEPLDEGKNPRHRIDVAGNFLVTERKTREAGDVLDVVTADAHIEALRSREKSGAKSYTLPCAMSPRLLD